MRALTDGTGKVVQTYRTDAFGQVTGSQGQSIQPFGFTGEQQDPESGLVFLRARAHSPALGRFMQRDPLLGSPAWWLPVRADSIHESTPRFSSYRQRHRGIGGSIDITERGRRG